MGLWGDIYNLWWLDLEEWSHGTLHGLVDADTGHPWEAFSFPRHSLSPPLSPLHLSRSHKFFFCFTKAHHQRTFMFAFPSQGLYYIGKAGLECINLSPHPQSAAMISQSCVNTPSTNDLWLPLTEKASLLSAHVSFFFFSSLFFTCECRFNVILFFREAFTIEKQKENNNNSKVFPSQGRIHKLGQIIGMCTSEAQGWIQKLSQASLQLGNTE